MPIKLVSDDIDTNISYNCSYHGNVTELVTAEQPTNGDPVGKLFIEFCKYYGWEFNFDQQVISIRTRAEQSKHDKKWDNAEKERNYMCIEDPFETMFNVGRTGMTESCLFFYFTVSQEGLADFRSECIRAYKLLTSNKDWERVCAKINWKKNQVEHAVWALFGPEICFLLCLYKSDRQTNGALPHISNMCCNITMSFVQNWKTCSFLPICLRACHDMFISRGDGDYRNSKFSLCFFSPHSEKNNK